MSYYIEVLDTNGDLVKVEVSAEVYEVFEDERKRKERERNEKRRHGTDITLNEVLKSKSDKTDLDERLINCEKLERVLESISACTESQQKRFYLNRILGYSYKKIAQYDECSESAVRHSVNLVCEKIKKFQK